MINFTNDQIDILYELCEIQLNWLNKNGSNITFEEVLKINHQKLNDILSSYDDLSEDFITETLLSVKRTYQDL